MKHILFSIALLLRVALNSQQTVLAQGLDTILVREELRLMLQGSLVNKSWVVESIPLPNGDTLNYLGEVRECSLPGELMQVLARGNVRFTKSVISDSGKSVMGVSLQPKNLDTVLVLRTLLGSDSVTTVLLVMAEGKILRYILKAPKPILAYANPENEGVLVFVAPIATLYFRDHREAEQSVLVFQRIRREAVKNHN